MSSPPQSLWHQLKLRSYPRESRDTVARVSSKAPLGGLTGAVGPETQQLLSDSGVLRVMQSTSGTLRPVGLFCETVNLCNSDCVFCPYSLQTRKLGTMATELFEVVCRQYAAMGGGPFSLTPVVGDVLLDRELSSRIRMLQRYQHSIQPSFTTNLYALDRHSDEVISQMLETFVRIHVSTYGVTEEENKAITQRNHFHKYAPQARRLAELWERSSRRCRVSVSFRNLHDYQTVALRQFVLDQFGHDWFGGTALHYANWGGKMSGELPGDARWIPDQDNHKTCIMLILAVQVYWDGRVSACACCDYDAGADLRLGDIRENTLTELYASAANRQIWADQEAGRMQGICQHCTFHVPLSQVATKPLIGQQWFDFIGG